MFKSAAIALALCMTSPALAQRDEFDVSKFPPATLAALASEKPADAKVVALESLSADIARGTFSLRAAPADVEHQGVRFRRVHRPFRAVATYAGERRESGPELRQAIEHWGGISASREGYGTIVFRTELAFSEDGKTYWIPVYMLALAESGPGKPPHFRKGGRYTLLGHSVGWLKDGRPILVVLGGLPEGR